MAIDKQHSYNHMFNAINMTWLNAFSKITVLGLGMSGFGVCQFLSKAGFTFSVQDSRESIAVADEVKKLDGLEILSLGGFDQKRLLESDLIIVSPGISLQTPELQAAILAGITISGDVDIVSRLTNVPLIAITGSNGKSTVTELAGHICKHVGLNAFVGGNIGLSVMELLDSHDQYDIAILELSSFQLETVHELSADNATILNISSDHLDRYNGSLHEYASAKLAIYTNAKKQVWNRQDAWLNITGKSANEGVYTFGLDEPQTENDFGVREHNGLKWLAHGEHLLMTVNDVTLLGEHNIQNVLATFALLAHLELDQEKVKKAISSFVGLPHRMQKVRDFDGVVWVNDSKATNVGAAIAAINGLKGDIILLAGGEGKDADFDELIPWLEEYVSTVYLFGKDAPLLLSSWKNASSCHLVDDLKTAVNLASDKAVKGQYVLLAPACASFDMFTGFEQRGEQFMQMVEAL